MRIFGMRRTYIVLLILSAISFAMQQRYISEQRAERYRKQVSEKISDVLERPENYLSYLDRSMREKARTGIDQVGREELMEQLTKFSMVVKSTNEELKGMEYGARERLYWHPILRASLMKELREARQAGPTVEMNLLICLQYLEGVGPKSRSDSLTASTIR